MRILQNTFSEIKNEDDRNSYWQGLEQRIRNNQLTSIDKETLRLMGFDDSGNSPSSGDTESSGYAIDPNWKGDKDALKGKGLGIKRTDEGRWQLIGDADNEFLTNNWWTNGLDFLPEDMQKGFLLDNGT